jgi:hypothetical protein
MKFQMSWSILTYAKGMFADNPFLAAIEVFTDEALLLFGRVNTVLFQGTNGEIRVEVRCYLSEPPSPFGYLSLTFSYDLAGWQEVVNERDAHRLGWVDDEEEIESIPDIALLVEGRFEFPQAASLDREQVLDELEAVAFNARSFGSSLPEAFVELSEKRSLRARELTGSEHCRTIRVGFEAFVPLIEVYRRSWAGTAREWHALACDLAEVGVGQRPPEPFIS